MVKTKEQQRVSELLKNSLTFLLNNQISFTNNVRVEALIGITVDDRDTFVVSINEDLEKGANYGRAMQMPTGHSVPGSVLSAAAVMPQHHYTVGTNVPILAGNEQYLAKTVTKDITRAHEQFTQSQVVKRRRLSSSPKVRSGNFLSTLPTNNGVSKDSSVLPAHSSSCPVSTPISITPITPQAHYDDDEPQNLVIKEEPSENQENEHEQNEMQVAPLNMSLSPSDENERSTPSWDPANMQQRAAQAAVAVMSRTMSPATLTGSPAPAQSTAEQETQPERTEQNDEDDEGSATEKSEDEEKGDEENQERPKSETTPIPDPQPSEEPMEVKEEPVTPDRSSEETEAQEHITDKESGQATMETQDSGENTEQEVPLHFEAPEAKGEAESGAQEHAEGFEDVEVKDEPMSPSPTETGQASSVERPAKRKRVSERVIGVVEKVMKTSAATPVGSPVGLPMLQVATFEPPSLTQMKATTRPQTAAQTQYQRTIPIQTRNVTQIHVKPHSQVKLHIVTQTKPPQTLTQTRATVPPQQPVPVPQPRAGGLKYTCDLCNAYFIGGYQLVRHKRQAHGVIGDAESVDAGIKGVPDAQKNELIEMITAQVTAEAQKAKSAKVGGAKRSVGGARKSMGGAKPSEGEARNSMGGAKPSEGGARKSVGGAKPSEGGAKPSEGGARKSVGGTKPSEGGARKSLSGGNTPGTRSRPSGAGATTPVGGTKPSVGGAKTSVGGAKTPVGGAKTSVGGAKRSVGGVKTSVGGVKVAVLRAKTPSTSGAKPSTTTGTKVLRKKKVKVAVAPDEDEHETSLCCQFCSETFTSAIFRKRHEAAHFGPQRIKNLIP